MIRLEVALRRKAGMSREDFQQYWREQHGPLVAKHSVTLGIHRYVQLHTLDDPINEGIAAARGGLEPPYDGVAEAWWKSPADLGAVADNPAAQAAMQELSEDEKNFIDLPNSPMWFAYEHPQINPDEYITAHEHSPLVKLFFCLRYLPGRSVADGHHYWSTSHGPLIRGVNQGFRAQRYLQVHHTDDVEGINDMTAARGIVTPPYAGHAEAWFNRADLMAMNDIPEARRALEIAVEDEKNFIDFQRSTGFIGKEYTFIDRR